MTKRVLFIYTSEYPVGQGETFVENELKAIWHSFDEIHVFPAVNGKVTQWRSENICIHQPPKKNPRLYFKSRIKLLGYFILISFKEVRSSGAEKFIRNIRSVYSVLKKSLALADLINNEIRIHPNKEIFHYSFWMNEWALALALLSRAQVINGFIFRVHGYDLYEQLRPDGYLPFRYFIMQNATSVFPVCQAAARHLKSLGMFPEKVKVARLGVYDSGVNILQGVEIFQLVSCSSLNWNKRVEFIPEILSRLDFPVKWIHFGGKGNYSLSELEEKCKGLPAHVKYEFKGQVSNDELLNYYKNNPVHLFVHLSKTEGGVPVVLQEAAMAGIPLMGTNTGGIPEIINEQTGILLPLEIDPVEVAARISDFRISAMNTIEFRSGVRKFAMKEFDATTNANAFLKRWLS